MNSENSVPDVAASIAKQRLTWGLAAGVLLWGIYLAVGAVLFNYDVRKGLIVFTCTSAFLGLWWSVYRVARVERTSSSPTGLWNYVCSIGFLLSVISIGTMAFAMTQSEVVATGPYRMLLAVSMFTGSIGAICSIVGLSSRTRFRGKWLGIIAMLLLIVAFVMGFWVPMVTV